MNLAAAVKVVVIGLLALALLVPVLMIQSLVWERQGRRNEAVSAIAEGWGKRQSIAGPYLAIPYERHWTVVKRETNSWKYPLIMAGYLFALAYLAAFITYRVVDGWT